MALSVRAQLTAPLQRLGKRARAVQALFQEIDPEERTTGVFLTLCKAFGIDEKNARLRWGVLIAVLEANDLARKKVRRGGR